VSSIFVKSDMCAGEFLRALSGTLVMDMGKTNVSDLRILVFHSLRGNHRKLPDPGCFFPVLVSPKNNQPVRLPRRPPSL